MSLFFARDRETSFEEFSSVISYSFCLTEFATVTFDAIFTRWIYFLREKVRISITALF